MDSRSAHVTNTSTRKSELRHRSSEQSLLEAAQSKETSAGKLLAAVRQKIESASLARIDYAEIVGAEDLQPRLTIAPRSLLAVAVFFGKTRLIDNILLG